jgi:hypothetical protein
MKHWAHAFTLFVLLATGCSSLGGAKENAPVVSLFETRPTGASVFVNGGFVGTTPARFTLPAEDRVDVRLEFPGYVPQEDVLVRRRSVPVDAEEGVGWESNYYYELMGKR